MVRLSRKPAPGLRPLRLYRGIVCHHGKVNAVIRRVASQRDNVHVVSLYATFLGHGSHCRQFWRRHYDVSDPHYWFYDNIEDPNDRGYDAIRRVFLNGIIDTRDRLKWDTADAIVMPKNRPTVPR